MNSATRTRVQQGVFILAASLAASGCLAIQTDFREVGAGGPMLKVRGAQARQTRSLGDFTRVVAGTIYEVDVSIGSHSSVTFDAPKDLLPHLVATVSNDSLDLSVNTNFDLSHSSKIKAHVVTKRLTGVSISGAGTMVVRGTIHASEFDASSSGASILSLSAAVNSFRLTTSGAAKTNIDRLTASSLEIQASGAANCRVNGQSRSTEVSASGSCTIGGSLVSSSAEIRTSGACHASLRVKDSFSGDASGASSIDYSGHPSVVHKSTSGMASIRNSR